MSKEFGSGAGTAAPAVGIGRAISGSTVPAASVARGVETSFHHTIPAPAKPTESFIKTPTITHKFGPENARNITFGKPISQDTFQGKENLQGLKVIAKNTGETSKNLSPAGKLGNKADNAAGSGKTRQSSTKEEQSRHDTEIKPNPNYFQPDILKREPHTDLVITARGKTDYGAYAKGKALENPGKTLSAPSHEAQRLSKTAEEQGIHLDIAQITEESKSQQKKAPNSTAVHSENTQALMQDYISEYIKPNTRTVGNNADVPSPRKNAIAQTEPTSFSEGKIKSDGRIAAKEFNKDVEQAKRVSEAYDAYMKSLGSDSPASQEEGRKLSLRALDLQLQRNGVKEAVVTAYSTGIEKNTAQFEDIADLLEKPQIEEEEKAMVKTEQQIDPDFYEAKELSEVSVQTEPDEQYADVQEEIETELSEESSYQEILDDVAEEPEYILERDEKANEMRKAYALSAAQIIFSANGQQAVSGPQIVSLMPNDDLQPQEVKSQIIQELLRDDGSYKDVLSIISSAQEMDTLQEVKSVVDAAVDSNTAVRVVEIEQKSAPVASEQEKDKVLDESVRPIKKASPQAQPSY